MRDWATAEKLKIMLRIGACLMAPALIAVFLPDSTMAALHAWLGLGPLPSAPIVSYLSRSASALYAVHGGLLWVVANDVLRYRPIIAYLGHSTTLLGVLLLGIDFWAGLPSYWALLEGPIVMAIGLTLTIMERRLPTR